MQTLASQPVLDRRVVVAVTERSDGDVHPIKVGLDELARRQRSLTARRWAMLDQRHGTEMVGAAEPIGATLGVGDVLVSDDLDLPLAVWAADCAAMILVAADGRRVGAHAGWRGLAAGVVDVAVDAIGPRPLALAVVGPVIGPCCYPFGRADLESVAVGVGAEPSTIAATTAEGGLALDVRAAIDSAFRRRGLTIEHHDSCTRCDERWYSHRGGDVERHAVIAVSEVAQ